MNANELADGLEDATNKLIGKEHELGGRAIIFYTEAATMLRQQQAEIEALKKRYEPKIVDMCLRTDEQGRVLPQREIE